MSESLPESEAVVRDLLVKLESATGKERVRLLNQWAWEVRGTDAGRALEIVQQAATLAESLGCVDVGATSVFIMSVCHHRLSDYARARSLADTALEMFRQAGDRQGEGRALNHLGRISLSLGDLAGALEPFQAAQQIAQSLGQRNNEASAWQNIGTIYIDTGDYADALSCLERGLALKRSEGDLEGEAAVLCDLGVMHYRQKNFTEAVRCCQQALAIARRIGNLQSEAIILGDLGNAFAALGNTAEALECFKQSLQLHRKTGNRRGEAECLLVIGESEVRLATATPPSAIGVASDAVADEFAEQGSGALLSALALAETLGTKDLIYKAHLALAAFYKAQGDAAQALFHREQYDGIKEEVFTEERDRKLRNLQIVHQVEQAKRDAEQRRIEAEQQRAEAAQQRMEAEQQRMEAEQQRMEAEQQRMEAEQRRMEAELYRLKTVELTQADRLKTELLAIAAHDLKNPLQSIIGFAALIKEAAAADPSIMRMSGIIELSSERMLKLINELLYTAALESGKLELSLQPTDFGVLAAEVIDTFKPQAGRKQQRLTLDAEADCVLSVDTERLREVLDNLIGNAIKYTPQGKRIQVRVKKTQSTRAVMKVQPVVRIEVEDEGQGLNADDMKKLFGKFVRLSATPTGGESSTGLGLSIVKRLVDLHGGEVWAESGGQGKGSLFIAELPDVRAALEAASSANDTSSVDNAGDADR